MGLNLSSSSYLLIISNLVPAIMIIYGGWTISDILVLYWAESGIIGFFNIFKIMLSRSFKTFSNKEQIPDYIKNDTVFLFIKIFFAAFFTVHFGGFMAGHAVFLFGLVLRGFNSSSPFSNFWSYIENVRFGILALFISHGYSFFSNYIIGKERETTSIEQLFAAPYPRIVVMHITILAGAFLMMALKTNVAFLIVFIIIKIGVDLKAHLKEREKFSNNSKSFFANQSEKDISISG